MPISADEVVQLYRDRKSDSDRVLRQMEEIRTVANDDLVIPLPEMDQAEKPLVANLISEGIDQVAMRVSSTMPHLDVPALNPRSQTGKRSQEYAGIRHKAILSWWEKNRMRKINRRRARFQVAYGTVAAHIKPDAELEIPRWHLRNPLHTFPSPSEYYDDDMPLDCVFAYRKSLEWLRKHYPAQAAQIANDRAGGNEMVTMLEYVDAEESVLVAAGDGKQEDQVWAHAGVRGQTVLERAPQLAEVCPVVTASRVTLDRVVGQFNQIIGIYQAQAKLAALDLIATEKSVFPDMALIGADARAPQLLGDQWKDGRTGEINEVMNGNVQLLQSPPSQASQLTQDRLERNQRLAGISPNWGGEGATNVRTGRAAEITMSAQLDFRIQEYQETIADAMELENKKAIAIAKGWFGDKRKSFHVNWKGAKGPVDYIPEKHFESDEQNVVFPMAGADVNAAIMSIGQRVGAGLISRDTGRGLDPLVDDPEYEKDLVTAQGLEDALMSSIQQMAGEGQIPPGDVAVLMRKVLKDNKDLATAVDEAQQEAQERQSQELPQGDPGLEPGLAVPGAGAEGTEAIPQVEPSMQNLEQILRTLRQPEGQAGGRAPAMVAN